MATELSNFLKGDRVRLRDTVLHANTFGGLCGTVVKTIKCRNMVRVRCDNGKQYDAFPQNVEKIQEEVKSRV